MFSCFRTPAFVFVVFAVMLSPALVRAQEDDSERAERRYREYKYREQAALAPWTGLLGTQLAGSAQPPSGKITIGGSSDRYITATVVTPFDFNEEQRSVRCASPGFELTRRVIMTAPHLDPSRRQVFTDTRAVRERVSTDWAQLRCKAKLWGVRMTCEFVVLDPMNEETGYPPEILLRFEVDKTNRAFLMNLCLGASALDSQSKFVNFIEALGRLELSSFSESDRGPVLSERRRLAQRLSSHFSLLLEEGVIIEEVMGDSRFPHRMRRRVGIMDGRDIPWASGKLPKGLDLFH